MKKDPYEMDSDIVKEALEKGWVPPESLKGKLHDTLPNLSANWNGPLQVMADLIPQRRHVEVAQTLVAFTEPISVYEFLANVYLTDELEED